MPKYLLLAAGLVDKLELVIGELEHEGYHVEHLAIMSGFRTPRYNQAGGEASGRGRVDIRDAEVVARAAERVEASHPALVGGVGIYPATGVHGPFTHVDVRGRRARWRGTGSG